MYSPSPSSGLVKLQTNNTADMTTADMTTADMTTADMTTADMTTADMTTELHLCLTRFT